MTQFKRKVTEVTAKKYIGVASLTVINDNLGAQSAVSGDFLVGEKLGQIEVIKAAKFYNDFSLVNEDDVIDTEPATPPTVYTLADVTALQAELAKIAAQLQATDHIKTTGAPVSQAQVDAESAQAVNVGKSTIVTDKPLPVETQTAIPTVIETDKKIIDTTQAK